MKELEANTGAHHEPLKIIYLAIGHDPETGEWWESGWRDFLTGEGEDYPPEKIIRRPREELIKRSLRRASLPRPGA